MEDRRAHERIDKLDATVAEMRREQAQIIDSLGQLVANTQELVNLVKGVKGFRSLILWVTPVVAAVYALVAWVRSA